MRIVIGPTFLLETGSVPFTDNRLMLQYGENVDHEKTKCMNNTYQYILPSHAFIK